MFPGAYRFYRMVTRASGKISIAGKGYKKSEHKHYVALIVLCGGNKCIARFVFSWRLYEGFRARSPASAGLGGDGAAPGLLRDALVYEDFLELDEAPEGEEIVFDYASTG